MRTVPATASTHESHSGDADELIRAVFYALRYGCFHPVPEPKPDASILDLIKWGAMRNLHDKIAAYDRKRGKAA